MVDILKSTEFKPARATAPTAVESTLATTFQTLPASAFQVTGFRGGRIQFFTTGLDNETATATIYALDPHKGSDPSVGGAQNSGWYCIDLGSVALTFSTAVGVLGTFVPVASRYADTIVWTPSTYGTARLVYVGGNIAAVSPVNNTIGELLVSDFGGSSHIAVVFTTYGLTAGNSINALVKLDV